MFANLIRRRVPQILGLYLGGCWVAVEFVSFLTERYLLSDALTDLTLIVLFAMTPAVIAMAWYHGTPGKDPVPKFEKVLVPANVLVTIALVGFLFYGKELGATATEVSVVDETGQTITRMAPKQSFRRNTALFFFDNTDGDQDLEWLRYGLPIMLQRDLEQDSYVSVWSPLDGYEQSGMLSLQRAGFADGLNVPKPLMRQIAESRSIPVFFTGEFSRVDGGYSVSVTLNWTNNTRPPETLTVQGRDSMEAVDALTVEIKNALDVPSVASRLAQDMSVSEHFSSSAEAVELFVQAMIESNINNDSDTAVQLWMEAANQDPTFSAAHLQSAMKAYNAGQAQRAIPALRAARQHDYKLLHDEKFVLKALEYSSDGQSDKTVSVYQTWADLYPDDVDAQIQLGFNNLYIAGNIERAIAAFEQVRSLAPTEYWVLSQIARLHSVRGENDRALRALDEYAQARPQDYLPWLHSGRLRLAEGDLAGARDNLSRAVLMASGRVQPALDLADLNLREGRFDEAQRRINEARGIASAPRQDAVVLRTQIDYFRDRGMFDELATTIDKLYEVESTYRTAINLMMSSFVDYVEDYAAAGRGPMILERLASFEQQFQPPINELVQVGYLTYYLTLGDLEKSRPAAARVRALVEQFSREDMQYLNDLADARIRELSGDIPGSIAAIRLSIDKYGQSVQSVENVRDRIYLRTGLAKYLLADGALDEARTVLEAALLSYPAHPVANLRLAQVFNQQGQPGPARERLNVALKSWANASSDYSLARDARALAEQLGAGAD